MKKNVKMTSLLLACGLIVAACGTDKANEVEDAAAEPQQEESTTEDKENITLVEEGRGDNTEEQIEQEKIEEEEKVELEQTPETEPIENPVEKPVTNTEAAKPNNSVATNNTTNNSTTKPNNSPTTNEANKPNSSTNNATTTKPNNSTTANNNTTNSNSSASSDTAKPNTNDTSSSNTTNNTASTPPVQNEVEEEPAPEEAVNTPAYTPDDILQRIQAAYGDSYLPNMTLDATMVSETFQLDLSLVEAFVGQVPMIGFHPDKVLIVKATAGNVAKVVAQLEAARQNIIENGFTYPANAEKVQATKVVSHGDYAAFLMVGSAENMSEDPAERLQFAENEVQKAVAAFYAMFN